jgi:hypothetical protein
MILNLFGIVTGITPEMTGNQHTFLLFIQQNHEKMQARKLIPYHFFCLLSFGTHGIASVARLQREEVSRSAKEHGGTGSNSTGIYRWLASSLNLQMI